MTETQKQGRGRPKKEGLTKREQSKLEAAQRRAYRQQNKVVKPIKKASSAKRPEDRNYHYTYKVTCVYNDRVFYGLNSSDSLDDGFSGKGASLFMSIENHGKDQHTYELLDLYPTRLAAKTAYNELKASQIKNPSRPEDKKFHFVYKTTRFDGKYYFGIHSTDNLTDGYMGSGTYIGRSLKKHGRDKHKIEILEFCESRDTAFKREGELVTLNTLADEMCMNNIPGGRQHGERVYGFTEESLKLIGEAAKKAHAEGKFAHLKGREQKSEHVAKRAAANTGKKRSKEQLENLNRGQQEYYKAADHKALSERAKKSHVTRKQNGSANGGRPKGIPMSEEQKQRQSESMKGKPSNVSIRASCCKCHKETTVSAIKQFHGKCS